MRTLHHDARTDALLDPATGQVVGRAHIYVTGRSEYGSLSAALLALDGQWTGREAWQRLGQRSNVQSIRSLASHLHRLGRLRRLRSGSPTRPAIYTVQRRPAPCS